VIASTADESGHAHRPGVVAEGVPLLCDNTPTSAKWARTSSCNPVGVAKILRGKRLDTEDACAAPPDYVEETRLR